MNAPAPPPRTWVFWLMQIFFVVVALVVIGYGYLVLNLPDDVNTARPASRTAESYLVATIPFAGVGLWWIATTRFHNKGHRAIAYSIWIMPVVIGLVGMYIAAKTGVI